MKRENGYKHYKGFAPSRDAINSNEAFFRSCAEYPLDIPDLKTALLYAEQDIKDRWKWYRDRYRRKLRK